MRDPQKSIEEKKKFMVRIAALPFRLSQMDLREDNEKIYGLLCIYLLI